MIVYLERDSAFPNQVLPRDLCGKIYFGNQSPGNMTIQCSPGNNILLKVFPRSNLSRLLVGP